MKIIELLNKIANGEELPKKIKYRDKIWEYYIKNQDYCNKNNKMLFSYLFDYLRTSDFINDEVEIIEEKKEIEEFKTNYTCSELDFEIIDKINELVRISNKYARLLEKVESDE